MKQVIKQVPKIIPMYGYITRSIFFGAGLSYSIETQNYLHIPVVFFFPITYGAYQLCKNRNSINPF